MNGGSGSVGEIETGRGMES